MKFGAWLSLRYGDAFFMTQIIFRNLLTKVKFNRQYLIKLEFYAINSNNLCESLRYKGAVS